jgi:hydroxypyruvate reductase
VLALISGGGSALMELPLPGVRLGDLQALNRQLLASGAEIGEINRVRRALSQIKAGGLARLAWPAQVVALILSDVVGDRLSLVASGPTVLTGSDSMEARRILQRHVLWREAPETVHLALAQRGPADRSGTARHAPRRRTAGRPARRPVNVLVGSNRHLIQAAARAAADLGFQVRVLTGRMQGEAHEVGTRFGARLRRAPPGSCLLMGGETTVTLTRAGRGGRNQELALAAGLALEGQPGRAVMAFASDGVDGPTEAAGAVVDGGIALRAESLGLDPREALARHDSYPLLAAVEALIHTGPTGTNLNDLVVGLSYAAE